MAKRDHCTERSDRNGGRLRLFPARGRAHGPAAGHRKNRPRPAMSARRAVLWSGARRSPQPARRLVLRGAASGDALGRSLDWLLEGRRRVVIARGVVAPAPTGGDRRVGAPSLADAEAPEHLVEHLFHVDGTDQAAQRPCGAAPVLRPPFDLILWADPARA